MDGRVNPKVVLGEVRMVVVIEDAAIDGDECACV
jgi:hypothetical protein